MHDSIESANEIEKLRTELKALRSERDLLRRNLWKLEELLGAAHEKRVELEARCGELEKKNADFISLYVAGYQFQPTLDRKKVIQGINEVVTNFIGAERYGLYLFDPEIDSLVLVHGNPSMAREDQHIQLGDDFVSEIARSRQLFVNPEPGRTAGDDRPLAALPLVASDELVGMVTIHKLLIQKDGLGAVDLELLELLGRHASTSLLVADLHKRATCQRESS